MKGETVKEISAFASVMRGFCHSIQPWLKNDRIEFFHVTPKDFNMKVADPIELTLQSVEEYVELSFKLLFCDPKIGDSKLDMILMNSSAALVVGGKAFSLIGWVNGEL